MVPPKLAAAAAAAAAAADAPAADAPAAAVFPQEQHRAAASDRAVAQAAPAEPQQNPAAGAPETPEAARERSRSPPPSSLLLNRCHFDECNFYVRILDPYPHGEHEVPQVAPPAPRRSDAVPVKAHPFRGKLPSATPGTFPKGSAGVAAGGWLGWVARSAVWVGRWICGAKAPTSVEQKSLPRKCTHTCTQHTHAPRGAPTHTKLVGTQDSDEMILVSSGLL